MMTGPGRDNPSGGGLARHIPVLLAQVLDALDPKPGETIVDGTFGAGGYSRAILDRGAQVVAIDRDPQAIAGGEALRMQYEGRLELVRGRFSQLDEHVTGLVDGVVLDVGVSSMQIDEAGRGFSFRADGPLDMRMSSEGPSAADVVNNLRAPDLTRIFGLLGEERQAGRIARMIERRRSSRPFRTTLDLADAIETLVGRRPGDKIHPATRSFQALRIFVNEELGELARALGAAERVLGPGGRLAVVSFHSLEDRMVKRFIADRAEQAATSRHLPERQARAPTFERLGGARAPSEAEVAANPRARSAKLRAARRTAAPARPDDPSVFNLPNLADLPAASER